MYYKKVKELEREIEKLKDELLMKKEIISRCEARIDAMVNGRRCPGKYCQHCEHCGPEKVRSMRGTVIITENSCLLDVPCPDFKRNGGPDPHA